MDYCYDVLINMNEDNPYYFYEWEKDDPLEFIKKIPIFRVNTKLLKDFYSFNIKVNKTFLEDLLDKTILKNNKISNTLKYACLLCDTKNALAVEFSETGEIIGKSNLLLDDEENILEFIYNYKEIKIEYEKKDPLNFKDSLRQEELLKKVVTLELNTIIESKNSSKLKYLFNEWFNYEEEDINTMYSLMINDLKNGLNNNIKKIYDLIMISYQSVN